METGIVKWYNDAKQFGYAWSHVDGKLIILEKFNILEEIKTLKELWTVSFEREDDPEFGLIAKNIKVINKELNAHGFLNGFENNTATPRVYLDTPSITVFENALPIELCNELIEKHTRDSMNPNSGKQSRQESFAQVTEQVENRGISLGMDPLHYDTLASAIVQYADIPFSHIEAADIYNYVQGQFLDLHHDYPYDPKQINYYKAGGDRVGTGIFYLNDDFVGGETNFPKVGVSIKPKAGSFLYFKQCYDEATNWSTIHESTKILSGTKWIASCFFSSCPRVGYSPRND
jgi:prolyl 4-hydroxylase|tara:strand:+ start:2419 stop:3285 length:867 start_codon:yes stop_codon:yes gene_type:complete